MKLPATLTLNNGLDVHLTDESNRYFGDYHRVCIRVHFSLIVDDELIPDANERDDVLRCLGATITFDKTLERMGVPSNRVEPVTQELIEDFLSTTTGYIGKPHFPREFVRRRMNQRRSRSAGY